MTSTSSTSSTSFGSLSALKHIDVRPPAAAVDASVRPPGSKSLSNRALLLAAMAEGRSELHGLLDADDTRHMLACLRALGVEILEAGPSVDAGVEVAGQGRSLGLHHPAGGALPELYVGTAGTVARFLVAALAATGAHAKVDGSARMRERPMATLLDALGEQGAEIRALAEAGALPIELGTAGAPVTSYRGGEITMARPTSSQFVSALAIAAAFADAPTRIVLEQGSPALPYITMTFDVMRAFGFDAQWAPGAGAAGSAGPRRTVLVNPSAGRATRYVVEPDASAASYFLALAAIYGGRMHIPDLGASSLQGDARFYEVLERFGARAQQGPSHTEVTGGAPLKGVQLDLSDMPDMTLTAAVVAAHATGPTEIRGVAILRHHESDRIAAGATELRKLGCVVRELDDGLHIDPPPDGMRGGLRRGTEIETYDDHRMAMAFALAGEVRILDPGCAAKTFPRYFDELAGLGMCTSPHDPGHEPTVSDEPPAPAPQSRTSLAPTRIDANADGVGTLDGDVLDGLTAHAPNLFPTERARVQIEHHAKKARPPRAHVRVLERLSSHAARREPPCVHHPLADTRVRGACTGCPLMALELPAQVALKRERVESCLGLELNAFVQAPEALGYRHSVKRVVGGNRGALILGSYVRGSHRVADMSDCRVDHPAIVAALDELVREANVLEIEAYRGPNARRPEASGDLRYVWAKTDGQRVVLTLITGSSPSRSAKRLPARLELAHAVAWSVQGEGGNAVRGTAPKALRGDPKLDIDLLGHSMRVGPLDFLQPNPVVAQLAYEALISHDGETPASGQLALDLYAGAGATTMRLREHFASVLPCESYPEAARALGVDARQAADFVAEHAAQASAVDLVIANPPRAGMGAKTCEALLALAAPRLHIMSCSPETLAKDLGRLSTRYEVLAVQAFDTLPQTAHVECVAWLQLREN